MKTFRSKSHQEINSELNEALVSLKLARQLEKVLHYYVLVLRELNKSQINSGTEPCHRYNFMNNAVISSINGWVEIRFMTLVKSLRGDVGL